MTPSREICSSTINFRTVEFLQPLDHSLAASAQEIFQLIFYISLGTVHINSPIPVEKPGSVLKTHLKGVLLWINRFDAHRERAEGGRPIHRQHPCDGVFSSSGWHFHVDNERELGARRNNGGDVKNIALGLHLGAAGVFEVQAAYFPATGADVPNCPGAIKILVNVDLGAIHRGGADQPAAIGGGRGSVGGHRRIRHTGVGGDGRQCGGKPGGECGGRLRGWGKGEGAGGLRCSGAGEIR